jgi:hypothetical protein
MKLLVHFLLAAGLCLSVSNADAQAGSSKDPKKAYAALQKQRASAKAAYLKNPKSAPLKKKYVDASLKQAEAAMAAPFFTPREKYPAALNLYREVLKVEPKNATALQWKKQIEDIYKSMGRPIPPG